MVSYHVFYYLALLGLLWLRLLLLVTWPKDRQGAGQTPLVGFGMNVKSHGWAAPSCGCAFGGR